MSKPDLYKILQDFRDGKIPREEAMKYFGITQEDLRNAIQNIELLGRIHAAKN